MADENPNTTPAAPAEPAPSPQEVDRARESFDRVAEKAGLREPEPATERPSGSVQTTPGAQPARDPADARPAGEADPRRADEAFRERRQKQAEELRMARYLSALEKVAQQAARAPGAEGEGGDEDELVNEFDQDTDYWNWYKRDQEIQRELMLRAMDQRLAPLKEIAAERDRRAAYEAEQRRASEQQEGWRREMAGIARDAHETYLLDPESQGYMDRVTWLVGAPGHPGDPARGIPPSPGQMGALSLGFLAAFPGIPEEEAHAMSRRHVDGMMAIAQRYNELNPHAPVNPARALDMFSRVQLAAALQFLGQGGAAPAPAAGQNGNGSALPAPPPSAGARRVAAAKEAASSGVAGSGSEGGAKGGDDITSFLKSELHSGKKLGIESMKRMARRFYGASNAQAMARLSRDMAKVERELRGGA